MKTTILLTTLSCSGMACIGFPWQVHAADTCAARTGPQTMPLVELANSILAEFPCCSRLAEPPC